MIGDAQRDAGETGPGQGADPAGRRSRHHERQGTRPEGLRQGAGLRAEQPFAAGGILVRQMGDQGVEARPPLGVVDPCHGLSRVGVGAEPVDRLGREGRQAAGAQHGRRRVDAGRIGGEHEGVKGSDAGHDDLGGTAW